MAHWSCRNTSSKRSRRSNWNDLSSVPSVHVELQIGDAVVVVEAGELTPDVSPWTGSTYVYVDDVDALFSERPQVGCETLETG
jgi:hypothetical protein